MVACSCVRNYAFVPRSLVRSGTRRQAERRWRLPRGGLEAADARALRPSGCEPEGLAGERGVGRAACAAALSA